MHTRILIVEDSPTQALRLKMVLEERGSTVALARYGQEGVEMATRHPPCVVVLDVNLPDIDGFEVCRRLKQHPATVRTPVIMLTVQDRTIDRLIGLEAGADAYIPKDRFAEERLLQLLRDLDVWRLSDHGEPLAGKADPAHRAQGTP